MTRKDAFAFLKNIAENADLLAEVTMAGKGRIPEIAAASGYSVTMDELRSVLEEIKGEGTELTDDDLEAVVGGVRMEDLTKWAASNLDKLKVIYGDIF